MNDGLYLFVCSGSPASVRDISGSSAPVAASGAGNG